MGSRKYSKSFEFGRIIGTDRNHEPEQSLIDDSS